MTRTVTPIPDETLVAFLQWALPRLDLRWPGVRKVRGQVKTRLRRRLAELELPDLDAYRARLADDAAEWDALDAMCRITISRFYRDRGVWDHLRETTLPALAMAARASGRARLCAWSLGCASGEEPWTLRLCVDLGEASDGMPVDIIALDADAAVLARAERGCYPARTLRELPDGWRESAFDECGDADDPWCLRDRVRHDVELVRADVRSDPLPATRADLVLCRNLAWTYFADDEQVQVLDRIVDGMRPGARLVIGSHEALPEARAGHFERAGDCVWRLRAAAG